MSNLVANRKCRECGVQGDVVNQVRKRDAHGGKTGRNLEQVRRSAAACAGGRPGCIRVPLRMAGHLASTAVGVIGRREGQSCLQATTNAPVLRPARLSTLGARLRSTECTQDPAGNSGGGCDGASVSSQFSMDCFFSRMLGRSRLGWPSSAAIPNGLGLGLGRSTNL